MLGGGLMLRVSLYSTQVRELESAAETGQSKLSLLQSEAKEKDNKIKKLQGELEVLMQLNKQIKKEQQEQLQQYQQLQQQLQQQQPRKRMNTTGKLVSSCLEHSSIDRPSLVGRDQHVMLINHLLCNAPIPDHVTYCACSHDQ